ncbi:MAG: DUF106 domain-containing protein [Halobacteriales archaeon]
MNTKKKIESLLEEDPELAEVLEAVAEVEARRGEVRWSDVRGDASSGQWGRLIEKGVLVEGEGDGFVLSDGDVVRDMFGLDEDSGVSDVVAELEEEQEDVDTSWSIYDKAAAVVGGFLIVFGYRDQDIQAVFGEVIGSVLLPLVEFGLPYFFLIMVLAVFTGLYSSYLQLYLMDWDWIRIQQKKVKEIQSELKEAQMSGDEARKEELQDEQMAAMGEQMDMFKMQFRPSVWILTVSLPIFLFLFWTFSTRFGGAPHVDPMPHLVMPFLGDLELSEQVFSRPSFLEAWLLWYILCSFGFGQMMRKALGVNPSA